MFGTVNGLFAADLASGAKPLALGELKKVSYIAVLPDEHTVAVLAARKTPQIRLLRCTLGPQGVRVREDGTKIPESKVG